MTRTPELTEAKTDREAFCHNGSLNVRVNEGLKVIVIKTIPPFEADIKDLFIRPYLFFFIPSSIS